MKHLAAACVCFIVLYGVDALCFGGRYFTVADQAIEQACSLDWQ
jgi:hypothetical protein